MKNNREKRLAAEAEETARLEAERLAQQRLAAEAAKQEEERLAAEAARLEAERRAAEEAKLERETKLKEEVREAIEHAKQLAADNPDFLPADVWFAAGRAKNDLLAHYISAAPDMVDTSDRGGWRPIHEAARAGNLAGIELLVSAGCDLTSRTGRTGKGGTALWWAIQRYGEDHEVVQLLRSHGALEDGPVT